MRAGILNCMLSQVGYVLESGLNVNLRPKRTYCDRLHSHVDLSNLTSITIRAKQKVMSHRANST